MDRDRQQLRVVQRDGIGILVPRGHLTLGDGAQDLTEQVDRLLARGWRRLVLDMAGVDYVDAAGLGMLLRCQRHVVDSGGRLVVTGIRSKVREMISLTDLGHSLEHVAGLERAIAILGAQGKPAPDAKERTRVA